MQVDFEKTTADDVVKVGDVNVVIKDVGKRPMVFGKSAKSHSQKHVLANDHEASSSSSANKYHQPRWCPPGLSHSQKRRVQRLQHQEQKEQEAEKLRDVYFNKKGQWFLKEKSGRPSPLNSLQDQSNHPRRPVRPVQRTGLTARHNRSDQSSLLLSVSGSRGLAPTSNDTACPSP